jgi:ABC-2 type transport system permease protein
MNTQPNVISEVRPDSQVNAPAVITPTQTMYWSVQRELWENRSLYIAPLAVAALFLVGFLISAVRLPEKMRAASALDPVHQLETIAQPYTFAALLLMGTTLFVAVFYCLDALYGERRDRSILFWKSLPVSDLTVILSKASVPVLLLPLVTFVITIATQWIMLMVSTVVLLGSGMSVAPLWRQVPFFQMSLMLLFHLVLGHGLYYAPFYGWLLLVSGWARRATFLWAALPLFAIGIVERIAFNTTYFATMLASRFTGGPKGGDFPLTASASMHLMAHLSPVSFLISPGLWIGLAVFALFLGAAVRIRRYQGPI